jgi:hypothetical protein
MIDRVAEVCIESTIWLEPTDDADCAWAVAVVLDRVIDALRRDPRVERRSLDDWELFFAHVKTAAEHDLAEELVGLVSYDLMIREIAAGMREAAVQFPSATKAQTQNYTGATNA